MTLILAEDEQELWKDRLMDIVSDIIEYENGELEEERVIALFQYLVDTGLAWTLQGSYGRTAAALIDEGYVTVGESTEDE